MDDRMDLIETIAEARERVRAWKREGLSIGLVPTMGYLHEGHQSLIERAARENDRVVVSVFVNPTQFGPDEDLESYPRDLDRDCAACAQAGAHLVFHPAPEEMYRPDRSTTVHVAGVSEELCGKSRPVHFDGVCLVVAKLFNIVAPDRAYFGEKDAQQLLVVRRMARDLSFGVDVVGCPIVREDDGLAKSSRNTYLAPEERAAATVLSRALAEGRALAEAGERSAEAVREAVLAALSEEPLARVEYVEIVDAGTARPTAVVDGPVLCALAARFGSTRLIDNFFYDPEN